ncbi:MAG: DUF2807 domain-containing protein, partial [Bacteroidales bacterium]|nr:DUF2807 domain-containing protein [Bacteroidales bacterium]
MEVRTGSPITTLILYNNVDVILTHRPQNDIQVSAPHRMIDKIETSINGSTLTIRNNNTMNWLHDLDPSLTVWVNVDSLSNIAFYSTAVLSTETA